MPKNNFASIESIINIAKRGGMFILVDDEKRENEGDLIISTSNSNAKNINFMAIKFIFFALELDVEIIKSPSFSLFSSSTKINIPPLLAILIILSIDAKLFFGIKIIPNVFR